MPEVLRERRYWAIGSADPKKFPRFFSFPPLRALKWGKRRFDWLSGKSHASLPASMLPTILHTTPAARKWNARRANYPITYLSTTRLSHPFAKPQLLTGYRYRPATTIQTLLYSYSREGHQNRYALQNLPPVSQPLSHFQNTDLAVVQIPVKWITYSTNTKCHKYRCVIFHSRITIRGPLSRYFRFFTHFFRSFCYFVLW